MPRLRFLPFLLLLLLPGSETVPRVPSVCLITGQVRDADGPLPGALVRFKGNPLAVHTDTAGRFQLPHSPGAKRITAWKSGYFIGGANAEDTPLVITLRRLP